MKLQPYPSHASEVVNMLFTEFDMDVALQVREREGEKNAENRIAANLLGFMDNETIAKTTGLTIREVEELRLLPSR